MSPRPDPLSARFHELGLRLTPQRRRVLDALEQSGTHLDAEAIHDRVKAQDPSISLATVYRTLGVLKDMDLVEEHSLGQEHGHYEAARPGPHYHFICRACGHVIEFDTPLVTQAIAEFAAAEGVAVASAHLRLSGACAQCQGVGRPSPEVAPHEAS
jgi:Fur family transcriptional regulator, peroxide stress response regulator